MLAACPEINAGWQYLHYEDAAVCVNTSSKLKAAVNNLVYDREYRKSYEIKARICLEKNHDSKKICCQIENDIRHLE